MLYSVIIPVYRNEEFVPLLISEFENLEKLILARFGMHTEFVFVVDMSPDNSYALLEQALPRAAFDSQLILHSRNFGSFAAMRTGLAAARGDYFAFIAADLQEPPELLISFIDALSSGAYDVVVGVRRGREDPPLSRLSANMFWRVYKRLVISDMPVGGADIFACNRAVRDELLKLEESHSSLLGLLFWLGFRRTEIGYERRARQFGESGWTFRRKLAYMFDSVFSFTDLPLRILTVIGTLGTALAVIFAAIIIFLRLTGVVTVPGYSATIAAIMFFGALNTMGIGLIGVYTWRCYENTKRRPLSVVQSARSFRGAGARAPRQVVDASE